MMWSLERLPEWLYWSIVRLRLDLACKVGYIDVLCYQVKQNSKGGERVSQKRIDHELS